MSRHSRAESGKKSAQLSPACRHTRQRPRLPCMGIRSWISSWMPSRQLHRCAGVEPGLRCKVGYEKFPPPASSSPAPASAGRLTTGETILGQSLAFQGGDVSSPPCALIRPRCQFLRQLYLYDFVAGLASLTAIRRNCFTLLFLGHSQPLSLPGAPVLLVTN